MAKIEGDPVLESEQEDIALSDSELDDVLKSADITSETAEVDDTTLEQYGVWVKVEPQNLEGETEQNMDFELSDLESSSESALTEEEEQLLGELEDDEDTDLGDLSGLEDDLEELGEGSAFQQAGDEDELSIEDLDVDLDELGDDSVSEEIGDLEEDEINLGPDSEIEVSLSDSAIVEEHYEDLATVESVPSTPGRAPLKSSSDVLEKIEKDLNQIKAEIQSLKSELAGLGRTGAGSGKLDVPPAPAEGDGFFEKGEDETIALTGDELDNILNTADVTEEVEVPEETVESPEVEELLPTGEMPGEAEEGLMELGSLDLEEEQPSAEVSLEEIEPSISDEQAIEIDIGGQTEESADLEEPGEELSLDETVLEEAGELDELEELTLEEPEPGEEDIETLEALGGEETDEALDLTEPVEELSLDEPELDEAGELDVLEELSLEEPEDEAGLEEAGELDELEELTLEEPEPGAEDMETLEALGGEETDEALDLAEPVEELSLEELDEQSPEEPVGELELAEEQLTVPEPQPSAGAATEELSDDLKTEIKSVLSYFDQLLEALPEEKIKEFAQSEYFVRYKRLFEELGLGA